MICKSFLLDLGPKEAMYSHMRSMFFQKLPKLLLFESIINLQYAG